MCWGIGKAGEWKHRCNPSVRPLWGGWATEAVIEVLRTTRVGCVGTERVTSEEADGEDSESEEGGPGPPLIEFFFRLSFISSLR